MAHFTQRPANAWRQLLAGRPSARGIRRGFTMLARPSPAVSGVLSSFPKLLNEAPGPPPDADGVWLIRPDGYVAATAPAANLVIDFGRVGTHERLNAAKLYAGDLGAAEGERLGEKI